MKKQESNLFTAISQATGENLSTEVKETNNTDNNHCNGKSFNAIDLWNIHRQKRVLSTRRQFA